MSKNINGTKEMLLAAIGGKEPVDARKAITKTATSAPAGWEPRVKYDASGTPTEAWSPSFPESIPEAVALAETMAMLAVNTPAGYVWILAEVKLDMGAWHRTLQGEDAVTKPTRRYRWNIVKDSGAVSDVNLEHLTSVAIKNAGAAKVAKQVTVTGRTLVVALADWQIGQADGDGVDGVVARLAQIPSAVKAEVSRLKKAGSPVDSILLAGLGDLVEGCTNNWYSNQSFVVTLDRRQQTTIARRMLLEIVTQVSKLGLPVTVTAVAGNHGENRSGGKVVTTYADNDDIAVFEQVADAITLAEKTKPGTYSNVKWSIHTDDRLVRTMNINGHIVALTHGHLARSGGTGAAAKAQTWWKGQALAREAAADADVLLMGHYHHLVIQDMSGRWFMQAPALCDRSDWFAQSYGLTGRRGLLTFTIGEGVESVGNIIVADLDVLSS